ncbi:unnamed protein product [Umbelopsis sp. WA50703]
MPCSFIAQIVEQQQLRYGEGMKKALHSAMLVVYSNLKLHHEKRPLSMKTDTIKKRQRYESGPVGNRKLAKRPRADDEDDIDDSAVPSLDLAIKQEPSLGLQPDGIMSSSMDSQPYVTFSM